MLLILFYLNRPTGGRKNRLLLKAFPAAPNAMLLHNDAVRSRKLINPQHLHIPSITPEEFEHVLLGSFESSCYPSCLYVDVGTNKGQALFPILRNTSKIHVLAFEPNKKMCDYVQDAADREFTNRVEVHCSAVGSIRSQHYFDKGVDSSASYHITSIQTGDEVVSVDVIPLDEIIYDEILLLKTDTQGFEKEVLLGSQILLSKRMISFLIVEISYSLLRTQNTTEIEILDLIYSWGYACSYLAWHGVKSLQKESLIYGILPPPQFLDPFISFQDFAEYLSPKGNPSGKSMWTDIICF